MHPRETDAAAARSEAKPPRGPEDAPFSSVRAAPMLLLLVRLAPEVPAPEPQAAKSVSAAAKRTILMAIKGTARG